MQWHYNQKSLQFFVCLYCTSILSRSQASFGYSIVEPILTLAKLHILALSEVHIPGMENWQVNILSCQCLDPREWSPPSEGVSGTVSGGKCWHTVNLLVSKFNTNWTGVYPGTGILMPYLCSKCPHFSVGSVQSDLCIIPSQIPTSPASENREEKHTSDSHFIELAQEGMVFRPSQTFSKLSMGNTRSSRPSSLSPGPDSVGSQSFVVGPVPRWSHSLI